MSDLRFDGQAVIVTGGCRGIGRGIAQRFAEAGAHVLVCCRNEPDSLPDGVEFVAADVREPEQIDTVIAACVERFGRLDILVNNAGGSPPADSATASPRFTAGIIGLNLTAPIVFAQRANAVMQGQEHGGSIVNIASVSGVRPSPETLAYGAAKAGLLNATQTMAVEFAPKVRVNAVVVGLVVTEQAHLFYGDESGIAAVGATVPLGRMADPTDVADVCVFLASPLARYVTGADVLVHGGGEKPAYMAAAKGTVRD
ncbi:MAG TPA: SDR family oxidoreductase [Acidimicrobiia bacterium]|jgi:NAD(P)-dependent dehydrogenase (short-subunit alcohol dehydrogenase family)|nr:SDR family oxidoreductase [Acidimicrobiia bacterium]